MKGDQAARVRLTVGAHTWKEGGGEGRARVQLCHKCADNSVEFGNSVPRVGRHRAPDPRGSDAVGLRTRRAILGKISDVLVYTQR